MTEKELKAYHQKMSPEELQMFFHFKKRGGHVPAKKGKGSYNRKKMEREWQKMKCPFCGEKFTAPEDTINIEGDGLNGKIIETYIFTCEFCNHSCVATATFETKLIGIEFDPN